MLSLSFVAIFNNIILNWQQCSSKEKQKTLQQNFEMKKLLNIQCKGKDSQFQQ